MSQGPNDRLKKRATNNGRPKIGNTVEIKIPDKEIYLMRPDEKPPEGGGTCSCHSVCACVPVSTCTCDLVCTCDSVCSTNTCACNPFDSNLCPVHDCTCQPVCSCEGHGGCPGYGCPAVCTCHPVCTCNPYIYPN